MLLRKPHGSIIIVTDSGIIERDTLICCHCQTIWKVEHGSGRERGWCGLCGRPHCGSKECRDHKAFEKKLDEYEKGLTKTPYG